MATTYDLNWHHSLPVPLGAAYASALVLELGTGTAGSKTITFGATNDLVRVIKLPKRVTISDALLSLGDHDSGTALVLTVRITDGTTTKTLIHQTSAGQAGGIARPTKIATTEDAVGWTTTSDEFFVEILVSTQAAGAQAAKAKLILNLSGAYGPGAAGAE